MSETKHTPWQWEYKPTSGYDYGSTIYWVPGVCHNIGSEAHARLIAAAPELLEALSFLTAVVGLTPIKGNLEALQEAYDIARAAIAKAKGEQP